MLARGDDNELTLHGHYLFTRWFVSLHTPEKYHRRVCNYIERHADELLAKYPSKIDDENDVIFEASSSMISDAVYALRI